MTVGIVHDMPVGVHPGGADIGVDDDLALFGVFVAGSHAVGVGEGDEVLIHP